MTSKHKSNIQTEFTIGQKVYVKLANSSPERIFTVIRIVDDNWIEVEHFDGNKYVIERSKAHITPTKPPAKKKVSKRKSKSIPTISTPMGGQPAKRQRGWDSLDEIVREERKSRKKKG